MLKRMLKKEDLLLILVLLVGLGVTADVPGMLKIML